MARGEHERDRRRELRESDETEGQGAVSQAVDLPADAHREHLVGHDARDACTPIEGERAIAKERVGGRRESQRGRIATVRARVGRWEGPCKPRFRQAERRRQ